LFLAGWSIPMLLVCIAAIMQLQLVSWDMIHSKTKPSTSTRVIFSIWLTKGAARLLNTCTVLCFQLYYANYFTELTLGATCFGVAPKQNTATSVHLSSTSLMTFVSRIIYRDISQWVGSWSLTPQIEEKDSRHYKCSCSLLRRGWPASQ
jgi:hypothetical protein